MHKTDFAPVLSATSNLDSVWIISVSQLVPQATRPPWPRTHDQSWARQLNGNHLLLSCLGRGFPALDAEPIIMAQFFRLKNLFHEVFPENAIRRPSELGLNGAIYNPAPLINNH